MKSVSRFEANLLRILQGFFGRVSSDQVLKLVQTEFDSPRCLSRNAVELAKDTLQKGVPVYLARQGGWRRERFLRSEKISEGRLWNRTPPEQLGLSFSRLSLEFLIWITANHPNRPQRKFKVDEAQLTLGDRLLFFLAYESLRGTEAARGLMTFAPFKNHAILWLAYVSDMNEDQAPDHWDFSPWMKDQGAAIFESLQPLLAARWLQTERQKLRIYLPPVMRRLGERQRQLLTNLFDAAESAERRDLCRFFLLAMKQHLRDLRSAASAPYHLELKDLRMADRVEVYQSAGASYRQMERMDRWNRVARGIGFYDEGYTAAQLWKSDWEQLEGDRLFADAQAQWHALEPLTMIGGHPNPTGTQPSDASNAN